MTHLALFLASILGRLIARCGEPHRVEADCIVAMYRAVDGEG